MHNKHEYALENVLMGGRTPKEAYRMVEQEQKIVQGRLYDD